jgi:DNA modification methylase
MIKCESVHDYLPRFTDCSISTILGDPPYNLDTRWEIGDDGRPVERGRARDFMNKWEWTSDDWRRYMSEAFRVLKHGGYMVLFGLPQSSWVVDYFATAAGFEVCQPLYWFFLSGFPKGVDFGMAIDRKSGAEREIVGQKVSCGTGKNLGTNIDITAPASDLAKQFDGRYYGKAPWKPCIENIMVYRKPPKTGSPLRDLYLYTDGDDTISPSCVNLADTKVSGGDIPVFINRNEKSIVYGGGLAGSKRTGESKKERFQCQLFVDPGAAALLDRQSGELNRSGKTITIRTETNNVCYGKDYRPIGYTRDAMNDAGGASKICHRIEFCDYEQEDLEPVIYCPKAPTAERDAGILSEPETDDGRKKKKDDPRLRGKTERRNIHATVKPLRLITMIARMFLLPEGIDQKWLVPFVGSGTEVAGIERAYREKWREPPEIFGCELNQGYHRIALQRIEYLRNCSDWSKNIEEDQEGLFD